MIPSLKHALDVLHLSDKQSRVLGVLLENGPMLAAAIAKEARLNRTTVYDLLHELSVQGLVSQTKKGGAVRYQALAPEMLPGYLERKREALEESKKQLTEIIPQLNLLRSRGRTVTRVQYFEGVEGIKQAYEDTLINNRGKKLFGFLGVDSAFSVMDPAWLSHYIDRRVALGVHASTIAIDTPEAREYKGRDSVQLRATKLLPDDYSFDIELVGYDDKVLINSFSKEKPMAVLIEDKKIAELMYALFRYISGTLNS